MKKVSIAMICDDKFVMPTTVAITSILKNKKEKVFYDIFIVTSGISAESEKILLKLNNKTVKIIIVNTNLDELQDLHHYVPDTHCVASKAALLKFKLAELLPNLDRVLYLDGDIIVKDDLTELYETDLGDNYVCAVHDTGKLYRDLELFKECPLYFNSGVMLLNLTKMRTDNIAQKLIETKKSIDDMSLMDQNVLNIVFKNHIKILDIKYNLLALNLERALPRWQIYDLNELFNTNYKDFDDIKQNAIIIHFSSKDKPWKFSNAQYANLWYFYYKQSPFKNVKLMRQKISDSCNKESIYNKTIPVIISLTSYPARINTVHQTIESLLKQNVIAEKIVLALGEDKFLNKEGDLPESLLNLIPKGLEILWCKDERSFTKYIPALKKFPDRIIVTADDDILYPTDWLNRLYKSYLKKPNFIHCHRAHRVTFDKNKKLLPYNEWKLRISNTQPSYNNFLTGVGGVLYPPNVMYKDIFREDLYKKLCPLADDIWFWAMAVLNNTKINIIDDNISSLEYIDGTQENCLWRTNVGENHNDVQLKNVLDYYPVLYRKINKNATKDFIEINLLQKIFSIKNQESRNNKWYKVVTILGLKFKFKDKDLTQRKQLQRLEKKIDKALCKQSQQNSKIVDLENKFMQEQSLLLKSLEDKHNKIYNQIRIKKEKKALNFRTVQELTYLIRNNLQKLPENIDLIVGVPRSGMIPAYLIGLFLNKNICSLNEFVNNILPEKGARPIANYNGEIRNILVVDDSINTGSAMSKVKERLNGIDISKYNISYCAVFVTNKSKDMVDYYFEIVNQPRMFQWNYLNHAKAAYSCYDIDGVLCVDPTPEQNDDGEKYIDFILNAKPLFVPSYEINSLVTSRLEKYRPQTEAWLKKHNIKYKNLYMLDLETAEERRKLGCHAEFKAKIYQEKDDCHFFIESEREQAKKIAEITGKQVICTSTDEYFGS